jgi:hypothetical protein
MLSAVLMVKVGKLDYPWPAAETLALAVAAAVATVTVDNLQACMHLISETTQYR